MEAIMEFISTVEFTAAPQKAWEKLALGDEITLTNDGKPQAILVSVNDFGFDETVRSIRQAKSMRLLNSVWHEARERGSISDAEIEEEIKAVRANYKTKI
jgi:PHD/YefM family antitoxin component YafN of YafNO toxin-antitoxin module